MDENANNVVFRNLANVLLTIYATFMWRNSSSRFRPNKKLRDHNTFVTMTFSISKYDLVSVANRPVKLLAQRVYLITDEIFSKCLLYFTNEGL